MLYESTWRVHASTKAGPDVDSPWRWIWMTSIYVFSKDFIAKRYIYDKMFMKI